MLTRIFRLLHLPEQVQDLERRVEILTAILQESVEEAALQADNDRDKYRLLYQLRNNLTKLRLRESAFGWTLGLENQMDHTQREIEELEAELGL